MSQQLQTLIDLFANNKHNLYSILFCCLWHWYQIRGRRATGGPMRVQPCSHGGLFKTNRKWPTSFSFFSKLTVHVQLNLYYSTIEVYVLELLVHLYCSDNLSYLVMASFQFCFNPSIFIIDVYYKRLKFDLEFDLKS